MQVDVVSEAFRDKWDAYVSMQPTFSLLQSWDWGEFKKNMGWVVYRIAVKEQNQIIACAQLLIKPFLGRLVSIAYIPRGPLCNWSDQDATSCLLAELHRITRFHKAALLTVEPPDLSGEIINRQIQQYGFQPSRFTNQPEATIVIDLSPSKEEILLQMRKKTRQYIHSAVREGITVRVGNIDDLPAYYEMMRATGKREHFPTRSREYYNQEWQVFSKSNHCILLMAFHKNQLLAVRTAYYLGKHAAEFHAGSVTNTSNLHPNYLLVWEAIQWAKEQGCVTYDLWGIPQEIGVLVSKGNEPPSVDRKDGLWGVYRFKSGFNKNVIMYTGAYDYVYQPHLYGVLSNKFVSGETLDRIIAWMDSFHHQ